MPVCVYVCVHARASPDPHVCVEVKGQLSGLVFPFYSEILGIELRLAGLYTQCFYPRAISPALLLSLRHGLAMSLILASRYLGSKRVARTTIRPGSAVPSLKGNNISHTLMRST